MESYACFISGSNDGSLEIQAIIPAKGKTGRIIFIEMMGVPGSYDASVYDHFEDKDQEGEDRKYKRHVCRWETMVVVGFGAPGALVVD